MPYWFSIIAGISFCISANAAAAENTVELLSKYNQCLSEAKQKIKSEIEAKCAGLATDAAITACNDRAGEPSEAAIAFCKMSSGITKAADVCTTEDAEKAAQKQKQREQQVGI